MIERQIRTKLMDVSHEQPFNEIGEICCGNAKHSGNSENVDVHVSKKFYFSKFLTKKPANES